MSTPTMNRREFTARTTYSDDGRTIRGLAVPFDTETEIVPGFREKIQRGAINLDTMPSLFYRHSEPIGVITAMSETSEGLEIEARVSDTALGRDAATLAKDGAIRSLSIGFFEREYTDTTTPDGATLRTQTDIDLREISLVPIPAYDAATITQVRAAETPTTQEGHPTTMNTPDTVTRSDLTQLEETTTDLTRRLSLLETNTGTPAAAPTETRSAGQLLQDAIGGDTAAADALRPFVGRAANTTTAADARINEPTFVRDLVRYIDNANPLMGLFATDALPSTGNVLEFARLKESTLTVAQQTAEGATLPTGGVATEVATCSVKTYGGGTVLTRQAIERSRTNVLDLSLRGMAIEAGKKLAADFATFFETTVKSQAASAVTLNVAKMNWQTLLSLMLDASAKFEDMALPCDGLIVDRATFELIAGMTDTSGRPIINITGNPGVNNIGTVSASGKYVDLDGLRIVTNRHLTKTGMGTDIVGAFYSKDAIRSYTSPLASLQDQGVLDLTNTFSVYTYAAFADEMPSGLVPLKKDDSL
nr:MAG TPA: head maturation protease [Caudoviricetes sp.]